MLVRWVDKAKQTVREVTTTRSVSLSTFDVLLEMLIFSLFNRSVNTEKMETNGEGGGEKKRVALIEKSSKNPQALAW